MEITKEQVEAVIQRIVDRDLIFVTADSPLSKDRITEKYILNEIIPYTVARLVCDDLGIEE